MKRNIKYTIFFALLPVFLTLLLTESCQKASDTTTPETQNGFYLKGSVINAETNAGIANARVYFGEQTELTTDASGNYQIDCRKVGNGNFDVRVIAEGYGYGFASAMVNTSAAMVNTIMLTPLSQPVTVGSNGGTMTIADPESFVANGQTILSIPAGAFASNREVSFTRFTGNKVPGYAPEGMLNVCTVFLGPADVIPSQPMEIRFALPFSDASLNNLPLLKYNFPINTWDVVSGVTAHVNASGKTATVQVTSFGAYSLGVSGGFSESNGTSGSATTLKLDPTGSSIDFSYLATNVYSNGTPATISPDYLRNVASQNTRLNGIRVSFENNTLYTYTYIGSKPDSLAPVKSTMTGYYRWVPKVGYATQTMPMTSTIHNVAVTGIITKVVYSPMSGYEYVHDQGGGGK